MRVMINPLVCEGCGDCSKPSNCVLGRAAEHRVRAQAEDQPVDLQPGLFLPGRLLPQLHHSGGRENAHREAMPALTADATPCRSSMSCMACQNIVFTGVGGTGVTTGGLDPGDGGPRRRPRRPRWWT
jgi:indolepyruvate ferredoxin oxidoreductase